MGKQSLKEICTECQNFTKSWRQSTEWKDLWSDCSHVLSWAQMFRHSQVMHKCCDWELGGMSVEEKEVKTLKGLRSKSLNYFGTYLSTVSFKWGMKSCYL